MIKTPTFYHFKACRVNQHWYCLTKTNRSLSLWQMDHKDLLNWRAHYLNKLSCFFTYEFIEFTCSPLSHPPPPQSGPYLNLFLARQGHSNLTFYSQNILAFISPVAGDFIVTQPYKFNFSIASLGPSPRVWVLPVSSFLRPGFNHNFDSQREFSPGFLVSWVRLLITVTT